MTRTMPDPDCTVPAPRQPAISCRQMRAEDIDDVVDLLVRGFPERSGAYWARALTRLRERPVPEPHPRFGYVMTDHGRLVGVVILIVSDGQDGRTMANVSSWYVEAPYRSYSSVLLASVFRQKSLVLFNISPTPSTIQTIEAQGFTLYCGGTFHALPALGRPVPGARVRAIAIDGEQASQALGRLAAYGCLCFEVRHRGKVESFAFLRRRFAQDRLPCAQLIYCSDLGAFTRFAGPLGRRLLRHGLFSVMIDANAPVPGLAGRYVPGRRTKYFRGDVRPPLNDLRETELVIFGP